MKKVYYQLKMYQKSPLRISSGDNETTDSDLLLDGRGCPFIPGSSIAGVLREYYSKRASAADVNELFGYVSGETLANSHVTVSDGTLGRLAAAGDYRITVRDGIRLDEWGVTVSGSKYDFQVVETKRPYSSVLEWTGDSAAYEREIAGGLDLLMRAVAADGISFGARTTRGYGNMSVTVKRKEFNFPEDLENWLMFDPFEEEMFEDGEDIAAESGDLYARDICISARIQIKGSFSVRVNTARAERLEDGSVPDSVPLSSQDHKPVIPGTSWAGVFRHHMLSLLRQCGSLEKEKLNRLFGVEETENAHTKSSICFDETEIHGGEAYSITRNAVDRFTQAPRNSALFTARYWQGGVGTLNVRVQKEKMDKFLAQLLAVALIDLDLGLLTFGGSAGTGQGRCEIISLMVNGEDATGRLKKLDSHFLEEIL